MLPLVSQSHANGVPNSGREFIEGSSDDESDSDKRIYADNPSLREFIEGSSDDESDSDSDNKRIYADNPSLRNARDFALMAEERWIIEKLKSIREQRNALKVEALYYQGLKADLYAQHAMEFGDGSADRVPSPPPIPLDNDIEVPIPEPMFPDLSPTLDQCFAPNGPLSSQQADIMMRIKGMEGKHGTNPSNLDDFTVLEGQCNSEQLLHLTVDHEKRLDNWDIEDPEYESEEEEEWSRVNLDMSMLVGHNDGE